MSNFTKGRCVKVISEGSELKDMIGFICKVKPNSIAVHFPELDRFADFPKLVIDDYIEATKNIPKYSYIIWNPDSEFPPTRTFATLEQALEVCEILINKYGGTYLVMHRVGTVKSKEGVKKL